MHVSNMHLFIITIASITAYYSTVWMFVLCNNWVHFLPSNTWMDIVLITELNIVISFNNNSCKTDSNLPLDWFLVYLLLPLALIFVPCWLLINYSGNHEYFMPVGPNNTLLVVSLLVPYRCNHVVWHFA